METYIESYELYHYGVRGMKWGVRRYQNKDGSLTAAGEKRYNKAVETMNDSTKSTRSRERAKKTVEKLGGAKRTTDEKESAEETRQRMLKSTDAREIYANRHLLSTNELNERINRIDTEARLKSKIVEDHEKTGMDYVNDKMRNTTRTINNASNFFKSVDGAYSAIANSAIGKTLAKQLGLELPKKEFDLDDFMKNINKKSTQEVMDANKRVMAEESLRKRKAERDKETQEAKDKASRQQNAQKQVDEYNRQQEQQRNGRYSRKGDDIVENRTYTKKNDANTPLLEYVERYVATGKDVVGEGTSRFRGWDSSPTVDAVYDGQRYVSSLLALEDKKGR